MTSHFAGSVASRGARACAKAAATAGMSPAMMPLSKWIGLRALLGVSLPTAAKQRQIVGSRGVRLYHSSSRLRVVFGTEIESFAIARENPTLLEQDLLWVGFIRMSCCVFVVVLFCFVFVWGFCLLFWCAVSLFPGSRHHIWTCWTVY